MVEETSITRENAFVLDSSSLYGILITIGTLVPPSVSNPFSLYSGVLPTCAQPGQIPIIEFPLPQFSKLLSQVVSNQFSNSSGSVPCLTGFVGSVASAPLSANTRIMVLSYSPIS